MNAVFDKLLIVPTSGASFDVSDMVQEISIYQSLTDHYMYCDLILFDTVNLGRAIPQDINNVLSGGFTGGELLIVQYYSQSNPEKTHNFILYERTNRSKAQDSGEVYILHGISAEGFEAYGKKISRAYGGKTGTTIGTMVNSVYSEFIGNKTIKNLYYAILQDHKVDIVKSFNMDGKDSGTHKFIIPNLTVDETIEFMCNEADSDDHIPQYLFYETSEGFWFYNLGTLAQRKPRMTYTFTEFNVDPSDKDQLKIISYQVQNEANILENAKRGLFKSKIIHLDVLKKRSTVSTFDYSKAVSKFKKLQPLAQRGGVSSADVNVTLMTSRQGHDNDPLFKLEKHLPKRIDHFLSSRRSYTTDIFSRRMTVMVPGTTSLNVGDVVKLEFPIKDGSVDSGDVKLDRELSGKYIITKLRNKIEGVRADSTFVTIFDCVKDTEIMEV